MFHLCFGLSDHLKALLDFVFGSRRRVKKVRIFRAWFSHVPILRKDCPFKARFVFAYGVDNSDKPSYLLWPNRGVNGQFLLVDPWSGNYFDLDTAKFMEPIGLEHFFEFTPLTEGHSARNLT